MSLGLIALIPALLSPSLTPGPASIMYGQWRVVSSRCPGICAMSTNESAQWNGKMARYSASVARFDADSCAAPSYASHLLTAGAFSDAHRVSLKSLGITADSVTVVEVGCNGKWWAPGSLIIIKDQAHIFTLWDGVFFEMVRV